MVDPQPLPEAESDISAAEVSATVRPGPSPAMALARSAATGDVAATRQLLEVVAPKMMRVVQVVLGSSHADVDDVVQQSLIALVQALPSFRGECEPAQYGARIAVRTAVAARKRARTLWARRDDDMDLDVLVSAHPLPSDNALAARRKALIRELLTEIPDEQAESMALRFMLGWSLEDVAVATHAPLNTVRSRLRIAKQALRKRIESDPLLSEELGRDE